MEQALSTYLRATASITTLVGESIDWGLRPQASGLPALGLILVSRVPIDSDEGQSTLRESRVQADCWATTMTGAKALATALKAALAGPYLSLTTSTFHGLWTENETDYAAEGLAGTDVYRTSLDFLIHHIE